VALEPDGQQAGVQPTGEGNKDLAAGDVLVRMSTPENDSEEA